MRRLEVRVTLRTNCPLAPECGLLAPQAPSGYVRTGRYLPPFALAPAPMLLLLLLTATAAVVCLPSSLFFYLSFFFFLLSCALSLSLSLSLPLSGSLPGPLEYLNG